MLIAPIVITVVGIASTKLSALESLGTALAGCGGAFLLTQLARDAGKKREKQFFVAWGGIPSVTIFRHRDTRIDAITKSRYHRQLAALVKGAKGPSPEEEQTDPAMADQVYSAWSSYLRVHTRDTKKYSLLFQENISYGYRRNLCGLRPLGITVSGAFLRSSVMLRGSIMSAHPRELLRQNSSRRWHVYLCFFCFGRSASHRRASAFQRMLMQNV